MTSSYHILARYDEMSYCGRARCTNDIRQRHREDLQNLRLETKLAQRLKIRHLVTSDSPHYEDGYDCPGGGIEYTYSDHCDPTNWFYETPCNQWLSSSQPSSPSLSSGSECSYTSNCGSPTPPLMRARPIRTRRESLRNRKRVSRLFLDTDSVKRDYHTLKCLIDANKHSSPNEITIIVSAGWKIIANAIDRGDKDLLMDALNLLTDLVSNQLVKIPDILHIFQQGLLIILKDSLSRIGNHQILTISFILRVLQQNPQATPYIIEVMTKTGFLDIFGQIMSMGTSDEILCVTKLYAETFRILCDLSNSEDYVPTVPENIAAMRSPRELSKLYDPKETLKRIVQPIILEPLANWLFRQIDFIESDIFRSALILLADCLGYITFYSQNIASDTEWVESMQNLFRNINVELLIQRSLDSSAMKEYPGSIRKDLERFQDFYKQWNSSLNLCVSKS